MSSGVFLLQVPPSAAAVWITPLIPRMARSSESGSQISPWTIWTPASVSGVTSGQPRTSARTCSCCLAARRATVDPARPVPPVTSSGPGSAWPGSAWPGATLRGHFGSHRAYLRGTLDGHCPAREQPVLPLLDQFVPVDTPVVRSCSGQGKKIARRRRGVRPGQLDHDRRHMMPQPAEVLGGAECGLDVFDGRNELRA